MKWSVVPALALFAFGVGCSDSKECQPRVVETEQECKTTSDCVEAGFKALSCVNGTCGRTCDSDSDCAAIARVSDQEKRTCPDLASAPVPTFICESQVCVSGCPDVACAAGETCTNGRCEIYSEGFEDRPGIEFVSFGNIGWNATDRELENDRNQIVFSGLEGCARGDEKCAGAAAEGTRFAIVERRPTPAQSTTIPTITCRACACCRECLLAPPSAPVDLSSCPGQVELPAMAMCVAGTPSVCSAVCTACDACENPLRPVTLGRNLLSCETRPAMKTCSSCQCTTDPCEARPECTACEDAIRCDLQDPGSSECARLHGICDAQGADGCFPTPIDRPRSALTDDEQALESKAINVQSAMGEVVLELDYVPFNVGEQYRRVVQGAPPSTWPLETQEMVIQLCGGNCADSASWVDAQLSTGERAALPRVGERRNGLRMGAQSTIDWRAGRIQIPIPAALRTSELRFRFVPRLAEGVRLGIDAVRVRRRER